MVMPERRIIDVDGAALEVRVAGEGRLTVCSTHPSYLMSAEEEERFFQDLAGRQRVVWVNPRGQGTSSPVQRQHELTFSQLVDDVEAVRARLGVQQWVYLGGSSGGCIGLLYALRYPQSLAGLIVTFSTASGPEFIADPAFDNELKPFFEQLHDGSWINLAYRSDEDLTIHLRANLDELGVFEVRDRLGEITLPTLVVAGQHDTTHPPRHARDIHLGIAGSEFLLLEHSGHGVADEDHDSYLATVRRFLVRLEDV